MLLLGDCSLTLHFMPRTIWRAPASISAEAIGIDSHIDTIQHVLIDGVDLAKRLPNGMVDFPACAKAA